MLSDKENTIPTENKKIMIAKVRRYEYADILDTYAEFEKVVACGKDHGYRAVDEENSSGVQIKKFSAI